MRGHEGRRRDALLRHGGDPHRRHGLTGGPLPAPFRAPVPLLVVSRGGVRVQARLAAALAPRYHARFLPEWSALPSALARQDAELVLVDAAAGARLPFAQLSWIRRLHPGVALVILLDPAGRELDLFRLGRMGVDEVVLAAGDVDGRALVLALERARARAAARRVTARLEGLAPPLLVEGLAWAVENAEAGPGPRELALGVARPLRRYRRELRRAGLPAPGRILLWGRLIRAAQMLQTGGLSVEAAALRLGYASPTSLARAFRRETGLPPSKVRLRGGAAWVMDALLGGRGWGGASRSGPRRG